MKLPVETNAETNSEAFRLIISMAFIALITIAGVFIFEQISSIYFHAFTFMGAHVITILAVGIIAAIASLMVILRFERLYSSVLKENNERKRTEKELAGTKAQVELYMDLLCHDINNMNTVALGFLEMAQNKLASEGKLDKNDMLYIAKPINNLKNSSELIDNVRKLQREKSGRLTVKVTDVGEILTSVKDQYASVPDRDLRINLNKACNCKVMANELLRDVFANLAGNAIKHSSGPLTINIGLTCPEENDTHFCRITVEDNGPGIPDDQKAMILDRSLSGRAGHRRGLGLYIVSTLVDDFHGRVWAEDRVPGDYIRGVRFVVMLPAIE